MNKFHQFFHMMGLHPLVGFGVFAIDWMLFAGEGATLGSSWVVSIGVAFVLTVATVLIQKNAYNEGLGLAIGKGLMIGILTAIPGPLPSIASFVGGALGVVGLLGISDNKDDDK